MNFLKNNLMFILIALIFPLDLSQLENCVKYDISLDRQEYYPGENLFVIFDINIDEGFHIYSTDIEKSLSPTYNEILDSTFFDVIADLEEPFPKSKYDPNFNQDVSYHTNNITIKQPLLISETIESGIYNIKGTFVYYACDASMCIPKFDDYSFDLEIKDGAKRLEFSQLMTSGNTDVQNQIDKGLFSFLLFSFGMGLIALLTPCVFPMIPITVSYFTKEGEKEDNNPLIAASIYGLGIIGTFTLIGLIFSLGDSDPGWLAANPWVNLFIGILFVVFSFNLFGYYEIQVPAFIRDFSVKKESKGGIIGILFMSLTFTLVSFTCTAAFIGSLLVYAQFGSKFWPTIGMLSFSTAFAFPFFFLALFPQYLSKLPKSGGWLNSVKVIMGFLELAAAFKFLSNTDLVMDWGIFTRDSVLAVWSFIFIIMSLYILGKISMPLDSKIKSVSIRRIILSSLAFFFGVYLWLGFSNSIKIHGLIESYLPPPVLLESENKEDNWLLNLDDAYEIALKENKPIFIDFTGYTCTNCRWMEINIFPLPEVSELLENNFILVKLYTDGKEEIHKKNKELEKERFGTVALPYYVILSPEDKELATFPGMDPNKENFIEFLNKGYNKFKNE